MKGDLTEGHLRVQQYLRELAPVTVHHVRLVVLDLEEERRPLRVRRGGPPVLVGVRGDVAAYDEPFDRFPVPFLRLLDLVCEAPHAGEGGLGVVCRFDEAPFIGEFCDDVARDRTEPACALVDAVKVQAGLLLRVREDVLFEGVVA